MKLFEIHQGDRILIVKEANWPKVASAIESGMKPAEKDLVIEFVATRDTILELEQMVIDGQLNKHNYIPGAAKLASKGVMGFLHQGWIALIGVHQVGHLY